MWPCELHHAADIINGITFRCLDYTSTPIPIISKLNVDYNPRKWKQLFFPVYELYLPLASDQPFDKWKEKITPGIYLGMYPIHARPVSLVLSLSTGSK